MGYFQSLNLLNSIKTTDYTKNVTIKQNLNTVYSIGRHTKLSIG